MKISLVQLTFNPYIYSTAEVHLKNRGFEYWIRQTSERCIVYAFFSDQTLCIVMPLILVKDDSFNLSLKTSIFWDLIEVLNHVVHIYFSSFIKNFYNKTFITLFSLDIYFKIFIFLRLLLGKWLFFLEIIRF